MAYSSRPQKQTPRHVALDHIPAAPLWLSSHCQNIILFLVTLSETPPILYHLILLLRSVGLGHFQRLKEEEEENGKEKVEDSHFLTLINTSYQCMLIKISSSRWGTEYTFLISLPHNHIEMTDLKKGIHNRAENKKLPQTESGTELSKNLKQRLAT